LLNTNKNLTSNNLESIGGLNILMVCPYFFPEPGGLQNYAYNISKQMIERGHRVTVLCSTRSNKNSVEYIDGIKVISQKPDFIFSNTPIKLDLFLKMSILVTENNFDLINAATPVPFYAEIASIVSKIHNIPFVLTYHNDIIKPTFFMNFISTIYNKTFGIIPRKISKFIITSSPYCYNESIFLKSFKNKLVLIPPAVDVNKYTTGKSSKIHEVYKIPINSKIIIFVGQLSKTHTHKGVVDLIKSFQVLLKHRDDLYLLIVGKGNMIPNYEEMCKNLNVSKHVIFSGFTKENELIEYYKSSDIVVLPSTRVAEGFGMVLIEGGACGKPVIGTKVGGIQYVIKDGVTGLLVPPQDPKSLANAVIKLLDDEYLSMKMGMNGRQLVEQRYSWDKVADITHNTFVMCTE
jgi:glycosyltransferase involved in cell wall biosynthesis